MKIATINIVKEFDGTIHLPSGVDMATVLSCSIVEGVDQNFMLSQVYLNDSLSEVSPVLPGSFVAVKIYDPCTGDVAYSLDRLNEVQAAIAPVCCSAGEFSNEFEDDFNI